MEKHNIIINSHIEILTEIDDFMETLKDLDLLNEEWRKVATQIWIKTRKLKKWETREEKLLNLMNKNWNEYDDWTKNYLISNKDSTNKFSLNFINSKIWKTQPILL